MSLSDVIDIFPDLERELEDKHFNVLIIGYDYCPFFKSAVNIARKHNNNNDIITKVVKHAREESHLPGESKSTTLLKRINSSTLPAVYVLQEEDGTHKYIGGHDMYSKYVKA